jgi:hypothetical protein
MMTERNHNVKRVGGSRLEGIQPASPVLVLAAEGPLDVQDYLAQAETNLVQMNKI